MYQISIEEAPNLAPAIRDILLGKEVIITDHAKPIAKIIPYNGKKEGRAGLIGSAKDVITYIADDFDAPAEKHSDKRRVFGSGKDIITYIAEDFDAPMEDFKDYM